MSQSYPIQILQRALQHVDQRINDFGDTEAVAIAWAVVVFMIPYKIFIPYYREVMGRCPVEHQKFLEADSPLT